MTNATSTQMRLFDAPAKPIRPRFNRALVIDAEGRELTAHLGIVAFREADHRLGLCAALADQLFDPRDSSRVRYQLVELLRERLGAMLCGQSAQDHLDQLAHDPALRTAAWDRPGARVAAERLGSQPTASRLQDWLALLPGNLDRLREAPASVVTRHLFAAGENRLVKRAALDVDAFPIIGYGQQEGLVYNAHHGEKVFLPLVASFSPQGLYGGTRLGNGVIRTRLYGGMPKTAGERLEFWREAFPVAEGLAECVIARADAEFSTTEEMNGLCADGRYFVFRHKSLAWLKEIAAPHTVRPANRPPLEGYHYTVDLGWMPHGEWEQPLRVILCVEDAPDENGQLAITPRVFFLVTNVPVTRMSADEMLDFYRQRGTFEDRIGEWNAVIGSSLSARALAENEATLLLAFTAFNFANLLRCELEVAKDPRPQPPASQSAGMDLGRFQRTFLNAVGSLERHGRNLVFKLTRGIGAWWVALWNQMEKWTPSPRFTMPAQPYAREWNPPPAHAFLFHRPHL